MVMRAITAKRRRFVGICVSTAASESPIRQPVISTDVALDRLACGSRGASYTARFRVGAAHGACPVDLVAGASDGRYRVARAAGTLAGLDRALVPDPLGQGGRPAPAVAVLDAVDRRRSEVGPPASSAPGLAGVGPVGLAGGCRVAVRYLDRPKGPSGRPAEGHPRQSRAHGPLLGPRQPVLPVVGVAPPGRRIDHHLVVSGLGGGGSRGGMALADGNVVAPYSGGPSRGDAVGVVPHAGRPAAARMDAPGGHHFLPRQPLAGP